MTGVSEPSEPSEAATPYVVELHDVGLRGMSLRGMSLRGMSLHGARPRERGGHGRHHHPSTPGLVNLTVQHGELITLHGPSGSGKSALLHVIGLVNRPATGSYVLNGRDTARLGDRDRAALRGRQIGLAFQRPHLLPVRTTLENVALPLRYAGWTRKLQTDVALTTLDRVGLSGRAQVMTADLSAAERKLVVIARALTTSPGLMLFDDPTTGLDEAAATRIVRLLISLHREGRTVFIATDDQVATASSSQRITLTRH